MGTAVPKTSAFFISYVVISGALFFIELLRFPIPFLRYLFVRMIVGKDIADREKRWNLGRISYHVFVPYQNLVITFGLVFAVLAPLILPFVLIYSIVGNIVWRHQIMYCYGQPYQTGGLMWPHFVDHVFIALLIAQLTGIGLLTLKRGFIQIGWTVPLLILTVYIWLTVNSQYRSTFRVLPLELACEVDEENEKEDMLPCREELAGQYVPKCLQKFTNPDLSTQDDSPTVGRGSEEDQSSSSDLEISPKVQFMCEEEQRRALTVEHGLPGEKKKKNKWRSIGCCLELREAEKGTEKDDDGNYKGLSEKGKEQDIEDSCDFVVDVNLPNGFDRKPESSHSQISDKETFNSSTINQIGMPDSLTMRQLEVSDSSTFRQVNQKNTINVSGSLTIRRSDVSDSSATKQTDCCDRQGRSFDLQKSS